MQIRSYVDLVRAFANQHVPYRTLDAQHAIELDVNRPPLYTTAAIVWELRALLIQLAVPLPFVVPDERMASVESAVVRLNHVLILPGFDISHATSCVYYRTVLSRHMDGAITFEEIARGLNTSINAAHEYFPLLRAVAIEGASPSQIVDKLGARYEHVNPKGEMLTTVGMIFGLGRDA